MTLLEARTAWPLIFLRLILENDVHISKHGLVVKIVMYQQINIRYIKFYTPYLYFLVYIDDYNRSAGNE
jgi:hypothetical protein